MNRIYVVLWAPLPLMAFAYVAQPIPKLDKYDTHSVGDCIAHRIIVVPHGFIVNHFAVSPSKSLHGPHNIGNISPMCMYQKYGPMWLWLVEPP